jgi:tetratricopeptide (TPR) repeat protein
LIARYLQLDGQEQEQLEIAHERAIDYYTANFQEWDGTIESCREILESFYHACELGQYGLAYGMLDRCVNQLNRAGQWRSLLPLYARLTIEWQAADDAEAKNLGWAWTRLGDLRQKLGDYRSAIVAHQQAQEIFDQIDFPKGKASSLGNLGIAYKSLGQYQRAIDYHLQWLEIAWKIDDRSGEAAALGNLGNVYQALGQYQRAIDCHLQHNKIAHEIGDRSGEAASLGNLGNAYGLLGQYQETINLQQQALKIKREIGDRGGAANSLGNLGNAYGLLGQYQEALDFQQQSLKIKREIGDCHGEGESLLNMGVTLANLNRLPEALYHFQQAKAIFTERQFDHMIEQCDKNIQSWNQTIAKSQRNQLLRSFLLLFSFGLAIVFLIYWLKR